MLKKLSPYIPFIVIFVFLTIWTIGIRYWSIESIVGVLGVHNAYALIFLLALLGGMTTFSGVPYHLVLVTFAAGGLNPWLLGPLTAVGVMLGDSTSYYLGYTGSGFVPDRIHTALARLTKLNKQHPKLLPLAFLGYGTLLPFSNDFITIPMGVLKYPFWRVIIPLGIGNLIFNTALAFLAIYAHDFILNIFS